MKKILDKFTDMLGWISGILFFIIFLINMMEIIGRSFFNHSFLWVSDLSVICVVWMICLAMAVGVYRKEHIFMDFLIRKMPIKIRKAIQIAIAIISIAFFIVLFYTGTQTALTKRALIFPSTQWSIFWSFVALPIFAFLSIIFMIPRLIEIIKPNDNSLPQDEEVAK